MMLRQWRIRHKSENTNVNQSKEIESSWHAKKPVENSSLGLPVPSSMCVSKFHRQPLIGSSSMEDAAGTARQADAEHERLQGFFASYPACTREWRMEGVPRALPARMGLDTVPQSVAAGMVQFSVTQPLAAGMVNKKVTSSTCGTGSCELLYIEAVGHPHISLQTI
ncbi:hypothetical protein PIB30_000003 [Stylosanthes scabra]|uniref:Uncharacterized protein n=1 Tax=Stylosanthes scabra TaxID=79078 RepID=A0ABU6Q1R6_9FABA|nr:hypothetical protein [Stylosanthes scabra]